MRDYNVAVKDALGALISGAFNAGEYEASRLIQALREVSRELDTKRDDMVCEYECRCRDCDRAFVLPLTVRRERQWGLPDNCPPCYKKSSGKVSGHADSFRYK